MNPGKHIGLVVLTQDYPGTILAVTQGYLDAYGVDMTAAEAVGLSLGHIWPGIVQPGHPFHSSWSLRHAQALRGHVVAGMDATPAEDSDEQVGFFTALATWDGQPALLITVVSTEQTAADYTRALVSAVLDPAGRHLGTP